MQNLNAFLSTLPGWLIAVIVVTVGWLAAGAVRIIVAKALRPFRFNQFCERIGVYGFLRKGGVTLTPCDLVGRGVYWIIVIAVLQEAGRILDIGAAVEFRQRAVAAFPALLSAALVLAVGLIVIAFLSAFVRTLIRNAGSPYANLWSRIIRWAGTIVVLAIAGEQAELRGTVFVGVLYIVITAFAFGMALAFGLGCKDMARNAMEKLITDLKERHRDMPNSDLEG